MAAHSSILAWEMSWTEGHAKESWDCKRVWHDLATGQQQQKSYREWRWNLPQVCEKGAPA